jgi:Asp-tRNA(Asn)/Glu-tRNA(Gln) amidotransferase C subunit
MFNYKFNGRVLNFTMIIDNELLKQLCATANFDDNFSDKDSKNTSFLNKLESVVHMFKTLDEIDDFSDSDLQTGAPLREDEIKFESLIKYLKDTKQFNQDKGLFEVPKVIETE